MAQMAIYTALNVGVGLLLNAIFPVKTRNEGPRLNDLAITSSAYGRFINIPWGTQRLEGNVIWGLPIKETVTEETISAKGGAKATNVLYSYTGTFSIAFGISGGSNVLRMWADGKIFYDKTSSGPSEGVNIDFKFYSGGETQVVDVLEEAEEGAGDVPAYRHLTRITFYDLPLADFGNRIPNITAEISYGPDNPIVISQILDSGNIDDGALSHSIDISTNRVIGFPRNAFDGYSVSLNDTGDTTLIDKIDRVFNNSGRFMRNVYVVTLAGNDNADNIFVTNTVSGISSGETFRLFGNGLGGQFGMGRYTVGGRVMYGIFHVTRLWYSQDGLSPLFYTPDNNVLTDQFEGTPNGSFWVLPDGISMLSDNILMIPDDDSGSGSNRMYFLGPVGGVINVASHEINSGGWTSTATTHGSFLFPAGSQVVGGWALQRSTGYLFISNGTSTVVFDPETGTTINSKDDFAIFGTNNYPQGNFFGQGHTLGTDDAVIETIDLSTLTVTNTIDMSIIKARYGGGLEDVLGSSSVWDERGGSVIVTWAGAPDLASAVLRVYLEKAGAVNASLDDIVSDISSSYQGQRMAGLDISDINVTGLSGETMPGFVINNLGSGRDSVNALRQGFMFDGVSSDWIMKFKMHDTTPVATIPEEFVGKLTTRSDSVVTEKSSQETDLPMRVNIHYSNRQADYDVDVEHAKRILNPVSTMYSNNEKNINLPMVFDGSDIPKQLAEKWLYTIWNGRKSYSTNIDWTYLALDPGDLINMGYDGGTVQMKLVDQNIGSDLDTEIVGAKEQSFSFSSTIGGSQNLGLTRQTFAAPVNTSAVFLDAPLLRPQDFVNDAYMIGYSAMFGNTDDWTSATIFKSTSGVTYVANTTSNNQAAGASVMAIPSPWIKDSSGDFPNRWQEISDGGTMVIRPIVRTSAWASATEANVLDGANAFAVVSMGVTGRTVEIIQYQDATLNVDGTVTLDRLLRGRQGTEDVADLSQMIVGDNIALLVRDDLSEENSIVYNNLAIEFAGDNFLWKTVTSGLSLESALPVNFTYGGRSLMPYSVADIIPDYDGGSGDIDVTWKRRSRITGYNNWPDDFEVPANENGIERYNVSLENTSDVIFITKTVLDASSVTFTSAEIGAENVKNCVITTQSATGFLSPEQRGLVRNFPT